MKRFMFALGLLATVAVSESDAGYLVIRIVLEGSATGSGGSTPVLVLGPASAAACPVAETSATGSGFELTAEASDAGAFWQNDGTARDATAADGRSPLSVVTKSPSPKPVWRETR